MINGLGFPSCGASMWGAPKAAPRDPDRAAATLRLLEATRETDIDLSITTDEGDTLTLSLHSEVDGTLAFYRRPGSGHHAGGRVAALEVSSSRDVEISIQGDLSEQERADISALVHRLAPLLGGAPGGGADTIDAAGLPDSLESFTLGVQRTESVVMIEATGGACRGNGCDDGAQSGSDQDPASAVGRGPLRNRILDAMLERLQALRSERRVAQNATAASGEPDIGLSEVDPRQG